MSKKGLHVEKKKAIFLDRDGTLNVDQGYVHKIEDFELLPGVIEGLSLLKEDYLFFIITNQPGIGKGLITWADFSIFLGRLITELQQNDIIIEKIESDLKSLTFKYNKNIIKPHDKMNVEVVYVPEKKVSNYKIVYIHLQGAEQPLYKIPAYIMVKGQ